MLVLLDSNIFISALLSYSGPSAAIYNAWLDDRFELVTCQQQIDEIRLACRNPRFIGRLQPHLVGKMLNSLYAATVWPGPIPHKFDAADPTDSFLLNLAAAAEAHYLVTGDKRSQILALKKVGATSILTPREFCEQVLHV
jgi:putative PIN family toxin of toxin-antitoxin system